GLRRVHATIACDAEHQLQRGATDCRERRDLVAAVSSAQRLVLRTEDAVLLHAPDGEDVGVTTEHRPAALADALLPLEQAARTLHQRETGHAQHLLRGVVRSWIADGAEEDGSRDRRHA